MWIETVTSASFSGDTRCCGEGDFLKGEAESLRCWSRYLDFYFSRFKAMIFSLTFCDFLAYFDLILYFRLSWASSYTTSRLRAICSDLIYFSSSFIWSIWSCVFLLAFKSFASSCSFPILIYDAFNFFLFSSSSNSERM